MSDYPVYIPYKIIQISITIITIISMLFLIFMEYDIDYKWVVLLPVTYMVSVYLFVKQSMLQGVGSIAFVVMYAFRMCILPILCAYGNFYLEPSKSIYMDYFGFAIILMCIECFIVFGAFSYYSKKYQRLIDRFEQYNTKGINESIILIFAIVALVMYVIIVYTHPGFLLAHYHLLLSSAEETELFEKGHMVLQSFGAPYYLAIILDTVARPIVSFALTNWVLKKCDKFGGFLAICVGLINILWISDRRIISFLVGISCMLQVLLHVRSKLKKHTIYLLIVLLAIVTLAYCFVGEDTPLRVARKFQRYFSGPSLTAIGIAVYVNYIQTPVEFLKLLFNDSIILSGLFDYYPLRYYVEELCGPAGKSIWTPMFIGAIQYFHIFAPLLLVGVVKFLVYTDYRARASKSDLRKMMFNYLTIAISVYMVMYSLELIYYNIIFIGGFYYLLFSMNSKMSIVLRMRRKSSEQ